MPDAVGVIQTIGFPSILAAADAGVKAGRVTLVWYDIAESGHFTIAFRGSVGEVKRAQEAAIAAGEETWGGKVVTHYLVPNPPANVIEVLPLAYTEAVERFM